MKVEIRFFSEQIAYVIKNKSELRRWIEDVVKSEGQTAGSLNFILCTDDYLYELNYKYLKHKSLTDILTFNYNNESEYISGDIYISFPRIRENAHHYKQKIENELHRVMIHGVLHLIGYNDSTKQEKSQMTEKENFYLQTLKPGAGFAR
ncbi:MAG: rRNA maturation RNase YbeY [Bacteroidetes bacterium]|nr:rRNA maturation RNase YbeY [Bacteroidota bacterium]